MDSASATLDLLIDLESRHDELLIRLDELDKRVQNVLTDWHSCAESRKGWRNSLPMMMAVAKSNIKTSS